MDVIESATRAILDGEVVVYPTETVYGLGGLATDADAIEAVFSTKRRDRSKPLSLAVPTAEAAEAYAHIDDLERSFMDAFLPGPVTVVCRRKPTVPAVLTSGRDRVGIRVPDHDIAKRLLFAVDEPITATSANVSGGPSVRRVEDLDPRIADAVAVIIDGGTLSGTASTVVDVDRRQIIREGALVEEIRQWLR